MQVEITKLESLEQFGLESFNIDIKLNGIDFYGVLLPKKDNDNQ